MDLATRHAGLSARTTIPTFSRFFPFLFSSLMRDWITHLPLHFLFPGKEGGRAKDHRRVRTAVQPRFRGPSFPQLWH